MPDMTATKAKAKAPSRAATRADFLPVAARLTAWVDASTAESPPLTWALAAALLESVKRGGGLS